MRVLIADDDDTSRLVLKTMLEKWGYNVVAVKDGHEASAVLREPDTPRLAILDWMMPGQDGIAVIEEAALLPHRDQVYIILLTSLNQKENIVKGLEAGADDYICKPFDKSELRARMRVGERFIAVYKALEDRMKELEAAVHHIKTLQGVLPICMHCKKIMEGAGHWQEMERYVQSHMDAQFSHGICPECRSKFYPDLEDRLRKMKEENG